MTCIIGSAIFKVYMLYAKGDGSGVLRRVLKALFGGIDIVTDCKRDYSDSSGSSSGTWGQSPVLWCHVRTSWPAEYVVREG